MAAVAPPDNGNNNVILMEALTNLPDKCRANVSSLHWIVTKTPVAKC